MSADPTEAFLVSLGQSQLLDANQLADVRSWVADYHPDPQLLAKELQRRGLLTPFQIKEIYKGRARDLTIGSYQLTDLLGEGGMGRVYKAKHLRLGRDVALKVIRKEKLSNPVAVGRFRQEIHAAAQLSHPNVVMAFDAEEIDGGRLCLSMEFVEGTDLTKWVRANGPMPIPQACDAVRQAAIGLQHAFERGLVHRDVKPSNLLLTPRGQVKVLDLGLALLHEQTFAGGENANRVTQEGFVLGTPDFLAPEQAQNPTGVDIRADVYGLGATLFYLLTGKVPYDGATPTEKMLKHVTEPPPLLRKYLPEAPIQLEQLIGWVMAKRADDRPQTPAHLALALAPYCPPQSGSFSRPSGPLSNTMPYPVPQQPAAFSTPPGQPPVVRGMVPQAVPAYPAPMPIYPQAQPLMPAAPAGPNPFANFDATPVEEENERPRKKKISRGEEADEPAPPEDRIRVRKPKQRSNLILVIFAAVALIVLCGGIGSVVIWLVTREVNSAKPLEAKFDNNIGMTMVKIEPGEFTMGSPDGEAGREDNEGPAGRVKLTQSFYMAQSEVSEGQYLEIMSSSPSLNATGFKRELKNRCPVDNVTYENAVEFCRRLSGKEGGRRKDWGYRLPTEAEWEYCARAGTSAPFAFGNKLMFQKHAIFIQDKDDPYGETDPALAFERKPQPYPVMVKPGDPADKNYLDLHRTPNDWGLFDTHGNLWEWCADFYSENYPAGDRTDPTGPAESAGGVRVIRGGSWNERATKARSASRDFHDPRSSGKEIGFRIVFAELKK